MSAATRPIWTHDYCRKIKQRPTGCHRLAGHDGPCTDAALGVGHVWAAVQCPAYRTYAPSDCTCQTR